MKLKLILILSATCLFLLLIIPHNKTAYSGKYYRTGNTDEVLILNPNNTFEIYCTMDKNDMEDSGKYSIKNNHIDLQYNHKNGDIFKDNISNGEVLGTEIVFSFPKVTSTIKFERQ